MIIFGEFRFSQTKFYANNEGLVIKQCMRKRIFISWSAIRNESQIDLANTRPTLAARLWELTIKSGDKFIVIFEDLDNVDELVDIIKTKTGLSLGM
jgi:hypothetical protein